MATPNDDAPAFVVPNVLHFCSCSARLAEVSSSDVLQYEKIDAARREVENGRANAGPAFRYSRPARVLSSSTSFVPGPGADFFGRNFDEVYQLCKPQSLSHVLCMGANDKHVCIDCDWIYDPAEGGKPFSELPADYRCPLCKAPKRRFAPIEECPECSGLKVVTCGSCKGNGMLSREQKMPWQKTGKTITYTCTFCRGAGFLPCRVCAGKGVKVGKVAA